MVTKRSNAAAYGAIMQPYSRPPPVWWRVSRWVLAPIMLLVLVIYGFTYALTTPYLIIEYAIPVLILAVLSIWALPDLPVAPTRAMSWLYYAFMIALIAWPNYVAIALPGLPWITLIRLTSFPLSLALVICASSSAGFRHGMGDALKSAPLVYQALLIFIVLQLVSIAFSTSIGESLSKLLVAHTTWTAVFFVSVYLFARPGEVQKFSVALWILALFVGAIAIPEARYERVLWAGHIPSFLKIQDETVNRILSGAYRFGLYRAQSTFSTPLGLAEFMALVVPFVMHFAAGSYKTWVRMAAGLSIAFILYVVLLTDARLGLIGFILGVLIYLAGWSVLRWQRDQTSMLAPAIVFSYPILFTLAVASTFLVGRIHEKIWGSGQYDYSNEGRTAQVQAGLPMIVTHPLGHGIGMGADALGYSNNAGTVTIDSYYLLIGLEYGFLGFIFYYAMFGAAIYYAVRYTLITNTKLKDKEYEFLFPLGISLINFVVIKSIFSNDDNHPLAFALMGAVVGLVYRSRKAMAAPATAG